MSDPTPTPPAQIETEIQAKGLTAPRITDKDVNDSINGIQYHVFPQTTTTVCCVTLQNGFTVVGVSAAASPENFNVDVGRKLAFNDAHRQIWGYLGHQLRTDLYRAKLANAQAAIDTTPAPEEKTPTVG